MVYKHVQTIYFRKILYYIHNWYSDKAFNMSHTVSFKLLSYTGVRAVWYSMVHDQGWFDKKT